MLENTLVVVTSDHGEEFFEHEGLFSHGRSLYIQGVHVPLIILFPGRVPSGVSLEEPVSLAEFPATLFDLIGLDDQDAPGQSWARFWDGTQADTSDSSGDRRGLTVLSMLTDGGQPSSDQWMARSLIQGDFHYIVENDGRELLYNLAEDPFAERDLAGRPEYSGTLERMRAAMSRELDLESVAGE
jgi:arylsulfatase A-like enzyme